MMGKTFADCMEEACRWGIAASEATTPEQAEQRLGMMAAWLERAKLLVTEAVATRAEVDPPRGERNTRRARPGSIQ